MRILFAVDLSEPDSAIRQVEELSSKLQADLYVLHVREPVASAPVVPVDPMSGLMGFAPYSVYDPMLEENVDRAEEDAFRHFLSRHFSVPVRPALRRGDAADSILRDADDENVDLIVLGRRHHGRIQRLLVGSVADDVVRHSKRPVMLIPILDEALDEPRERV